MSEVNLMRKEEGIIDKGFGFAFILFMQMSK